VKKENEGHGPGTSSLDIVLGYSLRLVLVLNSSVGTLVTGNAYKKLLQTYRERFK